MTNISTQAQKNAGSLREGWVPDKRLINYEYATSDTQEEKLAGVEASSQTREAVAHMAEMLSRN